MSPEMIIAISSTVIALAALFVSIWQGILTRQHNKLSVMPRLRIDFHRAVELISIKVLLVNKGTGPAIIRSMDYGVDKLMLTGDPTIQMMAALKKVDIPTGLCYGHFFYPDEVIAPGESVELLHFPNIEPNNPTRAQIAKSLDRLTFKIRHESIYKDKLELEYSAPSEAAALLPR